MQSGQYRNHQIHHEHLQRHVTLHLHHYQCFLMLQHQDYHLVHLDLLQHKDHQILHQILHQCHYHQYMHHRHLHQQPNKFQMDQEHLLLMTDL